jgi:peptidylprolyl isomerase
MSPGESKTIRIPAEKAYGPHRAEMMLAVERSKLPAGFEPEIGQQLQIRQDDGYLFFVTVAEVSASSVTLDANHPLAGKNLTFDMQLVGIG